MTPEERKAIAMRQAHLSEWHKRYYPKCCEYHEGFDAALALLVVSPCSKHDDRVHYAFD